LRQGFEALAHYYRLISDQASFQFVESDDKVTVRGARIAGGSLRMQRFVSEMMVAGFQRLVRCVRAQARPTSVNFEYPAPPYAAEYVRVFGDVVRFDQPFSGLVFDRALMDLPAPHKDEDVHEALKGLAERRLLRITQKTPYALRVRDLLVQQACPLRADMNSIARQLGMSVRSLRRRLAEEVKTYNDVATEALVIVAKQFLGDKQRTIQETAYEMGFSDTSTFHRAFKRWTGITPSGYREAQLVGEQHP
jgi:AraC-like DNA-binding protein